MTRALGVLLLALVILPWHALLAVPETGHAGAATLETAMISRDLSLSFLLLAALGALILGAAWPAMQHPLQRIRVGLLSLRSSTFALGCALLAMVLALLFNQLLLHGQPNLIDTVSQLLHARNLAGGQAAGLVSAFWHVQQSVVTEAGWVSQYPPGHVFLLALATRFGSAVLLGPVLLGVTIYLSVLLAEQLLPDDRVAARLGGVLLALSPFMIAHAGAYMSHTTAAACAVIALFLAVRFGSTKMGMAGAGLALGALFITRPLTGVTVGLVLAVYLLARRKPGWPVSLAALALGALPFAVALALYNQRFFGHALRFGYQAALGPNAGLGFGVDPWGNRYGLREAIGYTAAELSVLNVQLLETLLPAVMLIGAYLLLAPRPSAGEWLLIAWACAPLLTHLFYWHHGLFMGPRMLNEYAPAWCLLFARSLTQVYRALPDTPIMRYSPRGLFGAATVASLLAMLPLGPMRLSAYAQSGALADEIGQLRNALVFVHGSWEERIGMRLAARGMRLDSIETALRQNETCQVDAYARGLHVPLDFTPRATHLPPRVQAGPGSLIRASQRLTPECMREASADRFGALDVGRALLAGNNAVLVARDFGPELNAALIARHPARRPFLLMPDQQGRVVTLPYEQGLQTLWGAHE